jgi:cell division protein FtsW
VDLLKNIFKGDKVIWIIFLCLCLISIIEVFSAASTLTYKSGDHWGPITQHSIILMVGAVVVVLMHNIPYKWFQVFPVFLYPISVVLLAFVTLMGVITGERSRPLDEFYGVTVPAFRTGQDGSNHRGFFHSIQKAG